MKTITTLSRDETLNQLETPSDADLMKQLRMLSDMDLLNRLKSLVRDERRIGAEILEHLREVERRRLHASLGYSSLFSYCTEALGYSESAAQRRISAMRLMRDLPEVKEAVETGKVTLSNVAQVQTFLRREQKESKTVYSTAEKRELLATVSGLSSRECERKLAAISPVAAIPKEKERVITDTHTEIRFTADAALMEKLERVRGLLAHRKFNPSYAELLSMLADLAIKQLDPREKKASEVRQSHSALPTPEANKCHPGNATVPTFPSPPSTRYIAAPARRELWRRDQGICTFRSKETGKICGSRYGLEIEHLLPFALGGSNDLENLTLRCRAHNQLAAIRMFGEKKLGRRSAGIS